VSRRDRNGVVRPGAGHPRLVTTNDGYAVAGTAAANGLPTTYPLATDTTVLGGAIGQDVHLAGLPAAYGAIVRHRGDEYVYVQLDPSHVVQLNGTTVTTAALHHGDRLTLGQHELVFQRDEFADHGRFDGGRQGGEFSGDRLDRY
jgi:hypothetical protein